VYEISSNDFYSAIVAINAGVDMVMLPFDYKSFVQNVSWAVVLGLVPESRIDDAVSRILYAKFKLGLFDDTQKKFSLDNVGSTKHRSLAREAVAKSMVLLKNEGSILPISKGVRNIHVAGSAAHNVGKQSGAWTVEWQGIDGNWLPGATSILEGLQEVKGNNVAVTYSENGVFEEQGGIADVGIAVVGENPYAEGWGDNALPRLSEEDLSAIDQLKKNSRKVVVILVTGRPLIITDELPKWDAFVVAWLPGSEGGGVGDVLFGNENFVGTLPLSWPRSIEQVPITYDEKTADGKELLFKRYDGLITKK
jgi:beta-glucosidase